MPKFDPKTDIPFDKCNVRQLIECMQEVGLRMKDIAKLFGYNDPNVVSQIKIGYRFPGKRKLGVLYKISGGKLDLGLYLK